MNWHDYIPKTAQDFSQDGSTFSLRNGQTLSHVVQAWNRAHPNRRITLAQLRAANPGISDTRFRAGKSYRMPGAQPSAATPAPARPAPAPATAPARPDAPAAQRPAAVPAATATPAQARGAYPGVNNNPGNMRHYDQGWLGERSQGLNQGDFLRFDNPQNGLRAASRLLMRTLGRSANPTIADIVPIYSPTNENDVATHTANISRISGLDENQRLDVNNTGQMVDLLHGVVGAESGQPNWNWFTPQEHTNAVIRARSSF